MKKLLLIVTLMLTSFSISAALYNVSKIQVSNAINQPVQISEVSAITLRGIEIAGRGTASASSVWPTLIPENAIDGNRSTIFHTGRVINADDYWQLELDRVYNLTEFSIRGREGYSGRDVYNVEFFNDIGQLIYAISDFDARNTSYTAVTTFDDAADFPVAAVPVPAAAFLFLPAMIGFIGLRRKVKVDTV